VRDVLKILFWLVVAAALLTNAFGARDAFVAVFVAASTWIGGIVRGLMQDAFSST
jgi:membrane protein implicated in regulation of membrane protease activity